MAALAILLLALSLPVAAANGPQPSRGRPLSRADYDAVTALLLPGFNAKSFASLRYSAFSLYGIQPDGRACKLELELKAAEPGVHDPRGGETVINAFIYGESEDGSRDLVNGFSIEPRRVGLSASARARADNYVAVTVGPAGFSLERLARFTSDTVAARLRAPGKIEEIAVRMVLGFVTTTDFSCRFAEDPDAHYDAWIRGPDGTRP